MADDALLLPHIRSQDGVQTGIAEGHGQEAAVANGWLGALVGKPLVQFRMGYGAHLEIGTEFEVTIETAFRVASPDADWGGEPLTGEAAGALLLLNARAVAAATVAPDGTLSLVLGEAELTVRPHELYEAWQVRGPDGLLVICSPGGECIAVWDPTAPDSPR
jgi:hypothetical protein